MPEGSVRPVVLFDFDGVLVHGDSGSGFLRERIRGSRRRMTLALLVAPIALPLLSTRRWLPRGARIYARIARLGDTREGYEAHLLDYSNRLANDPQRVISQGIAALVQAQASGARVVVVSGSLETVVRAVLGKHGAGDVEILASRSDPSRRHCYGEHKIVALAQIGIVPPWDIAYSDSLADLPMLRGAVRPVLVNANASMARRALAALGRAVEQVRWS